MSKNPLPFLLALPALIGAIVLLVPRGRKRNDSWWLAGAAMLSAVPVAGWYGYVFHTWPNLAGHVLQNEMSQPRPVYLPVYYYLGLFGLIVPWTIWLVGGLIEPFKMKVFAYRRSAMLMLMWFAMIFIALSIPAAKQQRYILGIMPACGLLVGMFIRQHDERAASVPPRADRMFNVLSSSLWIMLGVASVLAVWFFASPDQAMAIVRRKEGVSLDVIQPIGWPAALGIGAAMLTIGMAGWVWRTSKPWRSSMAVSTWMLVMMPVYWLQAAQVPSTRIQAYVEETARIRNIVGDAPIRSLRWDRGDAQWRINQEFRIYFGRLIPRIWPDEFDAWIDQCDARAFVLAKPSDPTDHFLRQHGFELIDHAQVDADDLEQLWQWRGNTK